MWSFIKNTGMIVLERDKNMPNIKPVSDLRQYNDVLKDVSVGQPVFLTKNGRKRYVMMDMEEYEKAQATISLLSKLSEAGSASKDGNA